MPSIIEMIKIDAEAVADKIRRGESVSKKELKQLEAYNRLTGSQAGNAGKRKVIKTGK